MTHTLHRLVATALLTAVAMAQQHVTVPPQAAKRDGIGVGWVPGFDQGGREQFLIGQSALTVLVGQRLNAITLRRDGFEAARRPGLVDLSVWLSVSPVADVREVSAMFAANRGASPVLVYQGRVALPASPRLLNRDAAQWATPDAVTISFAQPWTYPGGHLCVELAGQPVANSGAPFWSIDTETDAVAGQRSVIGTGCGPMAARATPQASVDPRQLRPGSTARFTCAGDANATAFLMIAATLLTNPIDLSAFGAPGCELWVIPDIMLARSIGGSLNGRPPVTRLDLQLPPLTSFLGAGLASQWLLLSASGMTTSNALQVTLAGLPPQIDGSLVRAVFDAGQDRISGLTQVGVLPVMRLHW